MKNALTVQPLTAERFADLAALFAGTQSMFEKQGFIVVARRQWSKTSPIRPIMRREL